MKLKSMKTTAEEREEKKSPLPAGLSGGGDTYPYGTRLHLDHDTLEKLGVKDLPGVGKKMRLHARGRVISASENSHTDENGKAKKRRSVEIQLEHMGLEPHEPQSGVEALEDGIDEADGK